MTLAASRLAPFSRLLATAAAYRSADQLMVAGVPLAAAAVFGAPPDIVGLVVALQGSAWLLVSLPAGVMIDRVAPLTSLGRGMALSALGAGLATLGLVLASLPLFAFGAFLCAAGTVVGALSEIAAVPTLVAPAFLPVANGRLQLAQSGAMLGGPLLAGLAVGNGQAAAAGALTLLCALAALGLARGFKMPSIPAPRLRRPFAEIAEGFAFVQGQPLLRGVVACALFWNVGFFVLMAVFAPFALQAVRLSASQIGLALSAMGVGSLLAALCAGSAMARLQPRAILLFGPASSCAAVLMLLAAPLAGGAVVPAAVFALLGFGPILWFVCQNSIRQIVTPAGLLGRVSSVVQVAIYGVRSLGALIGGGVAARMGFDAALLLSAALFAASTAAVALSALIRLRAWPRPS